MAQMQHAPDQSIIPATCIQLRAVTCNTIVNWLQWILTVVFVYTQMKDLSHENLCVFVGASITTSNIFLAWMYCSKGSLVVNH